MRVLVTVERKNGDKETLIIDPFNREAFLSFLGPDSGGRKVVLSTEGGMLESGMAEVMEELDRDMPKETP